MSQRQRGTGRPRSFQVDFSTEIPAGTPTNDPLEVARTIPYDGRIKTLVVGWSSGSSYLAGVRLEYGDGEGLFPRIGDEDDGFIPGDGFTHPFDLEADIQADNDLVAKYANADPDNSHYINVLATIEEEGE